MATNAVAQETVFALRQEIARIEGTHERLTAPVEGGGEKTILRRGAATGASSLLRTGVERLDNALEGGLPYAALTEIHGHAMHDAGAVAGFALALAGLVRKKREAAGTHDQAPVLWIGVSLAFSEAGLPYAPGLTVLSGILPEELLVSQAPKPTDALWIAEEAARLKQLSAVVLEVCGNSARLDLTATRRLHRRAQEAGRPVFLLRQSARPEPTAAPVRLVVSPAPAASRAILSGPLADSIGHPAFTVTIGKSRTGLPGQFILEWNPHERSFQERRPENSRTVVPAPPYRPDFPAASGSLLAFKPASGQAASYHQPPREERTARNRARRAG